MPRTPVYSQIVQLRKRLVEESSVKKRREIVDKLLELLKDADVRRRLVLEVAVSKDEDRVAAVHKRHIAVSELWQVLLKTSIKYVHVIMSGRAKLLANDAVFPFDLLKLCDIPVFDNEPSKLSKQSTKDLLQYCLDMLDDVPTLGIEELESDMLNMLAYICSRKEFVAHFRPDQQMSVILEESERRLLADDPLIALTAARVFNNLLKTAGDLGIGLQLFISGTVSMVAKWTLKKIDHLEMIQLLLGGVDVLLASHPDLAIGPMTRYGKPIVSLAKRCLDVKLSRPQAHSVLSFLTNYVNVCQVAGKIQGKMIGDLGDLGAASLSYKNICYMIESLLEMTDVPDATRFDLIARLLACGQRVYLCRIEWVELDDPFKSLEMELERERSNNHEHSIGSQNLEENKACSDQYLSESPFAHYILRHFGFSKADPLPESQGSATLNDTTWHRVIPYLSNEGVTDQSLITRLGVLTAAVERFPLGACWASDSMNNWISIEKEVNDFRDSFSIKGGSLEDLSSVIHFVGTILERTGTSIYLLKLQSSALICLVRLVEAATVNLNFRQNLAQSIIPLRDALAKVWSALFSGDLFFGPSTKNCEPNSIGDYVLRLSQQIICFPGFDSNQVQKLQLDIWNLPAFSAYSTKNPAVFWLVCSVLKGEQLVAEGNEDSIMHPEFMCKWFPRPVDRHAKLLLFCVSHFHFVDDMEEEILTALSLCISTLLRASSQNMLSIPVVSWLSRMHRPRNQCRLPVSFPMTREEDVFRTLWTDNNFQDEREQVDILGALDHLGHDVFCSLTFFLTNERSIQRQHKLLPTMNGSEWFFAGLERLLRDTFRDPEDGEELAQAPSASGCLRLLKFFSFIASGKPHRVAQTADFFASVVDKVDLCKLASGDRIFFMKLSSQVVRALAKMECSAVVENFSLALSTLKDNATMILSSFALSSDVDTSGPGTRNQTSRGLSSSPGAFNEDQKVFETPLANGKRKADSRGESLARKRLCQKARQCDFPLTFEFVYYAASLLLTLNPVIQMVGFLCETLTGLDLTNDQSEKIGVIDVEGGKTLVRLLCCDFLFVDRAVENTAKSTLATIVLKTIRIIRSQSPPETNDHLFGFDICEQIVKARDGSLAAKNLKLCEVGPLIDMLDCQEKKTLSARPKFRVLQLATSASVFGKAQGLLHTHFDTVFTTRIVSPFLLDIHTMIRSYAAFAVGLALKKLDRHEIIDSVRRELKPIVGSLDAYREWYSHKLGGRDATNVRERQLFEDAREGFVFDVISTYWVVTVVSSNDPEVVEQMVFDYVWLAATLPELQSLCFQSIDRVARLLGFAKAESLLCSHQRSIAHRWLATEESLFEMPILVTAPSVVRRLIRFNRGKAMHDASSEESLAYERLSDFAASRFLELAIDDFVPQIVVSACKEIVESAITTDGRRFLLRNEYLRQMSSIFFDQYDDETVRKLLTKSLPALNCEKIILFHNDDEKQSAVSRNLDLLLDRLISNQTATMLKASMGNSLKKIIEVLGGPGGKHVINLSFLLENMTKQNGNDSLRLIEFLLFAYYRLLCASSALQRILLWQPMEQICLHISRWAQSQSGSSSNPDLLFGLKLLSDCLTRTDLSVLHPLVCSSINGMLTVATKLPYSGQDLSVVVRNLLGNAIELHNAHQQQILANNLSWHEFSERALATSAGLLREQHGSDAWGWQTTQTRSFLFPGVVDEETRLVMKGTFDLVSLLVSEREKLKLSPQVIVGMWRQFEDRDSELTGLGSVHQEFAAQMVLKKFSETQNSMHYGMPDTSLIEIFNEGIQKAQLEQLERTLVTRNGIEDVDLTSQLVDSLLNISTGSADDSIRCAASRCLGELNSFSLKHQPAAMVKLDEMTIVKKQFFAILEQCARTLMQLHSGTMYLAVDCFKSLSRALRGKVGFSSEDRFSEAKVLADVIPSSDDDHLNRSNLVLSDSEVNDLFGRYLSRNEDIWCWDRDLWFDEHCVPTSFERWICRITPALLVCLYQQEGSSSKNVSSTFLAQCQKLSCLDSCFATEVFKSLSLHLMLSDKDDELFARNSRDKVIEGFTGGLKLVLESCEESKDRRYIETIVDVLDTLRQISQERFLKNPSKPSRTNLKGFQIPFDAFSGLDGLLVASACVKVKLFKQAIFYAEIYSTERFGPPSVLDVVVGGQECMTDEYYCYLRLLYDSYKGLEQDDSCSAVEDYQSNYSFSNFGGDNFVRVQDSGLNRLEKLENLTHMENSWSSHWSLIECLSDMDLNATVENYVKALTEGGITSDGDKNSYIEEKAAEVRLYKRQWDDSCFCSIDSGNDDYETALPSMDFSEDHQFGFYCGIDRALDFLRRDDLASYKRCICTARLASISDLATRNLLANDATLDFYLNRFNVLNNLDRLGGDPRMAPSLLRLYHQNQRSKSLPSFITSFPDDDIIEAAVRSLPRHWIDSTLRECIFDHLGVKFERSISCGERKRSHGILSRLRSLHSLQGAANQDAITSIVKLRLKEARLLEKTNDFHSAIRLAKLAAKTCMNGSFDVHSWLESDKTAHSQDRLPLVAEAMTLCGIWTAKYRVEPSKLILSYQRSAVEVSRSASKLHTGNHSTQTLVQAYCAQAELASSLFESSKRRRQSTEWQESGATLIEREETLKNLSKKGRLKKGSDQDHLRYARELTREVEATRRSRDEFEKSIESYRFLSMQSSVLALSVANTNNFGEMSKYMYSFISLLFSCAEDKEWSDEIEALATQATFDIPSFRFVGLFSQLLSQLEAKTDECQRLLHQHLIRIVNRVSSQHPYHCVMQLVALSRSSKSRKAEAASEILADLSKSDPGFKGEIVYNQRYLFDAYVYLALANSDEFQRGASQKISFDNICKGSSPRLDRLPGVSRRTACTSAPCILTKIPDVRPDCNYGNGETDPIGSERIKGFETHFTIAASGLSRPKIVICLGTKGGRFKQLVKGGDDTRQDAVMEQVFQYVNTLLQKQRGSPNQGQLSLATYNVIPLTSKAGVLEWVDHCVGFSHFISGKSSKPNGRRRIPTAKSGAHERYYPDEWSTEKCNEVLSNPKNKHRLREVYNEVCQNFSPVYRFFFVEKFGHSAELWFQAKLRYTRSVATSSIVGHVLGIGDRHGSNIMMHQLTGEVIHIDFGIVFEQGKRLQRPEKVPFRLTRNVVDGMGPLGTKGVFTTAAETTLELLKENSNALLTILSAIVNDPLYKWTLGTSTNQSSSATAGRNAAAALAISRIQEKLQGYEEGTHGEQQTVTSQVQLLVNEAKDPNNLCEMYCGWGPHF